MHICFTSFDYPTEVSGGGVGSYVQTVGKELVCKGHDVSVLALKKDGCPTELVDEGVRIYFFSPGNIHYYVSKIPILGRILALPIRELEYSWGAFVNLKKINRKKKVEIIEGIETGNFFIALSRFNKRHIIRLHGEKYTFYKYTEGQHLSFDIRLARLIQRFAIKRVPSLSAPSEVHAAEISAELECGKDITVIPNPVQFFSEPNDSLREEKDRKYLLFVGRIERTKGIIPLLEAIPIIKEEYPNIFVKAAGNYHPTISKQEIDDLITKLDIGDNIEFLGHVNRSKLNELYRNSMGVVIPSYYETFGYIFLEALSLGIPVIAFNIGVATEFVKDEKNGFLVPVGDRLKLAQACIKLLKGPLRVQEEEIIRKFALPQIIDRLNSYYLSLLNGNMSYFEYTKKIANSFPMSRIEKTIDRMRRYFLEVSKEYQIRAILRRIPSCNDLIRNLQLVQTPTPENIGQPIHPSLISVPKGYAMAFTPYPNSNSSYEWPCVVKSRELPYFEAFGSNSLPVVKHTERKFSGDYLNDPELHFNEATGELWLYYIESHKNNTLVTEQRLVLKKSKDGNVWEGPVVLRHDKFITGNKDPVFLASPSIFKVDGKYFLFAVELSGKRRVIRMESENGFNWSHGVDINCALPFNLIPWHIASFSFSEETYLLISSTITYDTIGNVLLIAKSRDLKNWEVSPRALLKPSKVLFSSKLIYRGSAIIENGILKLLFSFKDRKNKWNIGYGEFVLSEIFDRSA